MEIIECPHCSTRVATMADGTCPSCRKDTRVESPLFAKNEVEPPKIGWEKFQESLLPRPVEPCVTRLRQIDEEYSRFRSDAILRLTTDPQRNREAADHIRSAILPQFVDVWNELSQSDTQPGKAVSPEVRDFVNMRGASWHLLAEALDETDQNKLREHIELWNASELRLVGIEHGRTPIVKPDPEKLVQDFTRALVTFTPKLLATPAIIFLTTLIFVVMIASGVNFFAPKPQNMIAWGADFGPRTLNGEWWRLLTNVFLHFGILHLGMNMWVLWDFGRLVERLVGNGGFVVLYLITGVAASITSLAWHPTVISAGASGAVFGVIGSLLGLIALRRDTIPADVLKHLGKTTAGFLGWNVYLGLNATGIDHAAHFGGFVAGIVVGMILSQPLSVEMVRRRRRRNLAAVITASILLPLAISALPAAPLDPEAELLHFAKVEEEALARFGESVRAAQRLQNLDASFADEIDTKILPIWIDARMRIERLADAPYMNRLKIMQLAQYARSREAAWKLYVKAMRDSDKDEMERADNQWNAANELAEKFLKE